MHLSLQILRLNFFIVGFDTSLLELFGFFNLFVVVFNHFLVSLGIDRRLSQRLLPTPFLNFHDYFSFLILANVLSDRFISFQLFSCPPNCGSLVKHIEVVSL